MESLAIGHLPDGLASPDAPPAFFLPALASNEYLFSSLSLNVTYIHKAPTTCGVELVFRPGGRKHRMGPEIHGVTRARLGDYLL